MIFGIKPIRVLGAVALVAGLGRAQVKAPLVSLTTAPVCPYLYRGDINGRYAFAEASEVALSYASIAVHGYGGFEGKSLEAGTALVAIMRATKAASEAYRCAVSILQPFERSLDKEVIALGARLGVQAYSNQVALNDRWLNLLREPKLSGGIAGVADQLSTLEVERDKLWVDLGIVANLSTLGLVDANYSDSEGHVSGTVLKRSETQEFMNRLVRDFPELKDEKQRDQWDSPTLIANHYLQFLTQPYKYADERPKL